MKPLTIVVVLVGLVLVLWLSGYLGGLAVKDMMTTRPATDL